jgi:hypothetical protein
MLGSIFCPTQTIHDGYADSLFGKRLRVNTLHPTLIECTKMGVKVSSGLFQISG